VTGVPSPAESAQLLIEDGVGEGGLADHVVPFVDGELAGDQRRAAAITLLDDRVPSITISESGRVSNSKPPSSRVGLFPQPALQRNSAVGELVGAEHPHICQRVGHPSVNAANATERPACQLIRPRPLSLNITNASQASRNGLSCGRIGAHRATDLLQRAAIGGD
jgi:hypothetical protein